MIDLSPFKNGGIFRTIFKHKINTIINKISKELLTETYDKKLNIRQ